MLQFCAAFDPRSEPIRLNGVHRTGVHRPQTGGSLHHGPIRGTTDPMLVEMADDPMPLDQCPIT